MVDNNLKNVGTRYTPVETQSQSTTGKSQGEQTSAAQRQAMNKPPDTNVQGSLKKKESENMRVLKDVLFGLGAPLLLPLMGVHALVNAGINAFKKHFSDKTEAPPNRFMDVEFEERNAAVIEKPIEKDHFKNAGIEDLKKEITTSEGRIEKLQTQKLNAVMNKLENGGEISKHSVLSMGQKLEAEQKKLSLAKEKLAEMQNQQKIDFSNMKDPMAEIEKIQNQIHQSQDKISGHDETLAKLNEAMTGESLVGKHRGMRIIGEQLDEVGKQKTQEERNIANLTGTLKSLKDFVKEQKKIE
jgi:hypothetical protein